MMRKFFLAAVFLLVFSPLNPRRVLSQTPIHEDCIQPLIVYSEFVQILESNTELGPQVEYLVRCIGETGPVTLFSGLGISEVTPSPDGKQFAYLVSHGRYLEEQVSAFLYDLQTSETRSVRENDGHVVLRWISPNELLLITWYQFPRPVSRALKPDHYWLYDPGTSMMTELNAPNGAHSWAGYAETPNTFFFMMMDKEVIELQRDGMSTTHVLTASYFTPYLNDITSDGQLLLYASICPDEQVFSTGCLAIFDFKGNSTRVVEIFESEYEDENIHQLVISPSNRYVALSADFSNDGDMMSILSVYDLLENRLVYQELKDYIFRFLWHGETDLLVVNQERISLSEEPNPYFGDLYLFDPLTNEWVQLTDSETSKIVW